eukprot:6071861-Amphidinium_carterae.1
MLQTFLLVMCLLDGFTDCGEQASHQVEVLSDPKGLRHIVGLYNLGPTLTMDSSKRCGTYDFDGFVRL